MKKIILSLVVLGFVSGAFARDSSVKVIVDNGKINGYPSNVVECANGARHALYNKNGTWYHGSLGHMGDKYNNWSLSQVAQFACKEL